MPDSGLNPTSLLVQQLASARLVVNVQSSYEGKVLGFLEDKLSVSNGFHVSAGEEQRNLAIQSSHVTSLRKQQNDGCQHGKSGNLTHFRAGIP